MSDEAIVCIVMLLVIVTLPLGAFFLTERHTHDWRITSVTSVNIYDEFTRPSRGLPARTRTDVGLICTDCGKPKIRKMRGTWRPKL